MGDIFDEINNGVNVKQFDRKGKYRVSRIATISKGEIDLEATKWTNDNVDEKHFLKWGDILLSHINSIKHIGKSAIFTSGEKVIHGINLIKFRPNQKRLNPIFAIYIFKSEKFIQIVKKYAQRAVNQASVKTSDLRNIEIPLPPLEVQQAIVDEVEGYQKIIDGARQVVENYRPRIKVDPDWPMVELGEVTEINPSKREVRDLDENILVSFVPMACINEHNMSFLPREERKLKDVYSGYTYFRDDDVLLARVTPCFENGKSGIAKDLTNRIGFGSSEYYVYRPKKELVFPEWIYYQISNNRFIEMGQNHMSGTSGLQRLTKDFASTHKIPLPTLDKQKSIIKKISQEQEIIFSNERLIKMFEKKIEEKIGEVWGEGKE